MVSHTVNRKTLLHNYEAQRSWRLINIHLFDLDFRIWNETIGEIISFGYFQINSVAGDLSLNVYLELFLASSSFSFLIRFSARQRFAVWTISSGSSFLGVVFRVFCLQCCARDRWVAAHTVVSNLWIDLCLWICRGFFLGCRHVGIHFTREHRLRDRPPLGAHRGLRYDRHVRSNSTARSRVRAFLWCCASRNPCKSTLRDRRILLPHVVLCLSTCVCE